MGEKEKDKPKKDLDLKEEGGTALDGTLVPKKKISRLKKINIILIILASLGLVSTAITSFFVTVPPENVEIKGEKKAEEKEKKKELIEVGHVFELEPFVINLVDQGGRRFLKVLIELEIEEKDTKELTHKIGYIRNIIINILSTKNYDDIKTIEGKDQLRADIVKQINEILTKTTVKNCFFTDFTVQ